MDEAQIDQQVAEWTIVAAARRWAHGAPDADLDLMLAVTRFERLAGLVVPILGPPPGGYRVMED